MNDWLLIIRLISLCLVCSQAHLLSLVAKESQNFSIQQKAEINAGGEWKLSFQEDFSKVGIGSEPETLFILDGEISVTSEKGNAVLLIPGSPVGEFGFLFGPRIRNKPMELEFTFKSNNQGRRYPSFAAGLGGMRGYRVRVNPAARKVLLSHDGDPLSEVRFNWKSGEWHHLRIQAIPLNQKASQLKFKLWQTSKSEPLEWLMDFKAEIEFEGGKCAVWGYPYSGLPIYFDNIKIRSR